MDTIETPLIYDDEEQRSEHLRAWLEHKYSKCKVRDIRARVGTEYVETLESREGRMINPSQGPDYVIKSIRIEYEVDMVPFLLAMHGYRLRIAVDSNGTNRIVDEQTVIAL